jgi:hypothetical protein
MIYIGFLLLAGIASLPGASKGFSNYYTNRSGRHEHRLEGGGTLWPIKRLDFQPRPINFPGFMTFGNPLKYTLCLSEDPFLGPSNVSPDSGTPLKTSR